MEDFVKGFQERYCLYSLFRNYVNISGIIFHGNARNIPTRRLDVTTQKTLVLCSINSTFCAENSSETNIQKLRICGQQGNAQ